jgi:hypothetical protein
VSAAVAKRLGRAADYRWRLFRSGSSEWPIDEPYVADPEELSSILGRSDAPRSKRTPVTGPLRKNTPGGLRRPTFFVGDQMFWGNDRIAIRHALLGEG